MTISSRTGTFLAGLGFLMTDKRPSRTCPQAGRTRGLSAHPLPQTSSRLLLEGGLEARCRGTHAGSGEPGRASQPTARPRCCSKRGLGSRISLNLGFRRYPCAAKRPDRTSARIRAAMSLCPCPSSALPMPPPSATVAMTIATFCPEGCAAAKMASSMRDVSILALARIWFGGLADCRRHEPRIYGVEASR